MAVLLRASGVPTRLVNGFLMGEYNPVGDAYIVRQSDAHSWVEVYLPRVGWFPIDPTKDDEAARDGKPYRYFGRLPWRYFAMSRGDGDRLDGGRLGWEYRSSMRWRGQEKFPAESVIVDRYARWSDPPEIATASGAAAGEGGAKREEAGGR